MSRKFLIAALTLCTTLVTCTSGATTSPTAAPRPSATLEVAPTVAPGSQTSPATGGAQNLTGKFTFAPGDGSIWLQEPPSNKPQPLVTPSPDTFADAPNFSPDGNTVAYAQSSLTGGGAALNTIHLVGVDGKNDRAVATPSDVKTAYNWPTFSPDGKTVYFTSTRPELPDKQISEILRVPVEGGDAEKVLGDARSAAVSYDGQRIAFLRFNVQTFATALWIADINGQNAKPLLADDVFSIIAAPRFSPDGQWILFVASGPPTRKLPSGMLLPGRECEPLLLCLFAEPAHANGLPWDLWLVSVNGDKFRQLTNVGADSPWPAWSRDGKFIAFMDTFGQYVYDVDKRVVTQLSKNGGHGVFDWWSGG